MTEMTEPSGDGANETPPDGGARRSRQWLVAGVVAAVVLVGGIVAVAATRGGGATDEAGATGTSAITESPAPSATGSPTADATSTPGGTATPTTAPVPEPSLTWAPGAVDDAVPLDDVATPEADVTVSLAKLEAVQGTAQGPGQVAGPALRVTLEVTNGTGEAIPLNAALVQVYCGPDRIPGDPLSGPGVSEFGGTLAAGDSATGVYVLTCPVELRDDVQITFGYVPAGAKVAFEGAAPRG